MLLILISFFVSVYAQFDADCITPTGLASNCISLNDCDKLKPLIRLDRASLNAWHCGFDDDIPRVCCPPKTPKSRCYTPKGAPGLCVKREACPSIMKMLTPPVSKANLDYVAQSKCLGPDILNVCCEEPVRTPTREAEDRIKGSESPVTPTVLIVTQNPVNETSKSYANAFDSQCKGDGIPSLDSGCCGVESSGDNRIYGGNATGLDQYPWLGLIEYESKEWLCGGSLISRRHVLTAAHCLVTSQMTSRDARSVRLGDYNITNDGVDCVEVEGGGEDCNTGPVSYEIELVKIHPDYNKVMAIVQANDIALILLKKSVTYTDFIRPICLPFSDVLTDVLTPSALNLTLYVAGWGAVSETRRTSEVKLHVDLPYYDKPKCEHLYSIKSKSIIWDKQICAGGVPDKDSCSGDSGGPLMKVNEKTLEIIGITSFGVKQCGNARRPSVYTKVSAYMDWIKTETIL